MKFKSNSPFTKSITPTAALVFLIAALILSSCAEPPAEVTIAVQEDGIELIASPTPTFVLPGPDDEDPIVDCVLDAPICLIDTAIEYIGEEPYLSVHIAIDPSNESLKGMNEELVLDGKVAIVHEGTHAGDVEVQDHTIAEASPDVGLILTNPEGEPLVNLITTVDGFLFYCNLNLEPRCPQPQNPAFSFDPVTGDIIILNNEGIPVGEVEYTFPPGVVFGNGSDDTWPNWIWVFGNNTDDEWPNWGDDAWPNWGWAFSFADIEDSGVVLSDPAGNPVATLGSSDGALFVFEPNGSPVANIGPNANGSNKPVVNFIDPDGNLSASLSLQEGKVVIAEEGGGPLMTLVIGEEGAGKVEEGESVVLRILVPLPEELSGKVEIAGTMEVSRIDASGVQQKLNTTEVAIEVEDIQAEKAVQKVDQATPVPTQSPAKRTPVPTEAPPKAAPTKAPTRPTPTPDNPKAEPTPTPSK